MRRTLFHITIDKGPSGKQTEGFVTKTTALGFDAGEAMDRALQAEGLEYHTINFIVATPIHEYGEVATRDCNETFITEVRL